MAEIRGVVASAMVLVEAAAHLGDRALHERDRRSDLTTLLHELDRRDARYGVETLCIGGGQGIAAIFERVTG